MKLLFIGDIFGEPGREAVKKELPHLQRKHSLDFVVANIENAAHGKGVLPWMIEEMQEAGVNSFTSGNHIWDQKEIIPYIKKSNILLRPANYPAAAAGSGFASYSTKEGVTVGVVNLQGSLFMGPTAHSPFFGIDAILEKMETPVILVDMHAEATSEKRAMGWYLEGRVSAVVGTHTHVPTADEEILPKGTAYISDVGMTGPYDSVIGLKKEVALKKFTTQMPAKFEVATDDVRFSAVLIEVEERTGRAKTILRIHQRVS